MRVLYIGTGPIGLPSLSWLAGSDHDLLGVVTQPDRPAGRKKELRRSPVKEFAQKTGLTVFQPNRIRDPESLQPLQALQPDLILTVAYGQILPPALLSLPKVACLNLHASLLPRHRGAAPIQAAILSGDSQTGMTLMYMAEGLDTGDILLQKPFEIGPTETGGELHDRLAEQGPSLLQEAFPWLEEGRAPRLPQDETQASYAPKLERVDGRLDWFQPAPRLARQVRAFAPWPGTYCQLPEELGARKLKVLQARATPLPEPHPPGTVLDPTPDGIPVATGEDGLLLTRLQMEGRKPMEWEEFLRGTSQLVGNRLLCPPAQPDESQQ